MMRAYIGELHHKKDEVQVIENQATQCCRCTDGQCIRSEALLQCPHQRRQDSPAYGEGADDAGGPFRMLSQIFGSQIEDASPHDGVEETTEQHQDNGYLAVYQ